ncbi:MAG: MurR/RpiR family transcriptional regulator [Synergistaceae bacterium]|jgi:DNA-binding MurR/RpiR family transcriptional regulator|nr:MurR/RpiR family transcriptional regulator [Synergistaceae bacterium]
MKKQNLIPADSLLDLLRSKSKTFSPKQYILARFVAQNYADLAYTNITELSFATGVSEPSITRFARLLGYEGFQGLQKAIRALADEEKYTHDRARDFIPDIDQDSQSMDTASVSVKKIVDEIFALEGKSIEKTYRGIQFDVFDEAASELAKAEKIVITAHGLNFFLADYATSYLSVIRKNVVKSSVFDIPDFAALSDLTDKDAVLAFTFPRYPTRAGKTLKYLREKNAALKIIGITDSVLSPIALYSNYLLLTPQWTVTFIDAYAAAMILTHALMYAVFLKHGKDTAKRVREYDRFVIDNALIESQEPGKV